MRNPRRGRNLGLILTALGVAAVVAAQAMEKGHAHSTLQGILGGAGLTVGFLSFCYLIYAWVETRRQQRLLQGGDVLARWTIDAPTWQQFLELNDALEREPGNESCYVEARIAPRADSLEVVIGTSAMMIGDDFHSLPIGGFTLISGPGWIDGPPACLEFQLTNYGGETVSGSTWALRVPIAPGSESEAVAVCEHYHARSPVFVAGPQNWRRRRNIALVIAAIVGPLGAAAYFRAMAIHGQSGANAELNILLFLIILGVMACPAALFCAFVFHLRHRRR